MPAAQVQPVGRHVRGRIEQHVPAVRVRLLDPLQWVLNAGEVRLRRVGEQVVVIADGVAQVAREQALVDAQIGGHTGYVRGLGPAGARELADPVDRVVVVEGEQKAIAGVERVGLADKAQRAGRIGREDRDVVIRRGPEEVEHVGASALDQLRARRRGGIDRVRVAEHIATEQLDMCSQLRLGEQAATGVVEVDVPAAVQARKVADAKLID
jgi:hypothetical protein